ncbi:MAG: hypothetical protein MI923_11400 [Phycisphaerales bacterium]|nr:hypothetical protein [Phycisphaerales bacterium]
MAKGSFKCPKCTRTFGMAAHLARHENAVHGRKRKKTNKKSNRARRGVRRLGRPRKVGGRKVASAARMGLSNMSLEQLSQLILAARSEAQRRISELESAIA